MVEYHPHLRAQLAQDRRDRLASDYRLAQPRTATARATRPARLRWPGPRLRRWRHRHAPAFHL